MKTYLWLGNILAIAGLLWSCAGSAPEPVRLESPDEQAIYDLMVARIQAINTADMDRFRQIYTRNAPELDWIEHQGIPLWKQNGMQYRQPKVQKITIIGDDAAAAFRLHGTNRHGRAFFFRVEALYVKEQSQWKIESTGSR